jgi:hypothetical protein
MIEPLPLLIVSKMSCHPSLVVALSPQDKNHPQAQTLVYFHLRLPARSGPRNQVPCSELARQSRRNRRSQPLPPFLPPLQFFFSAHMPI